MDWSSHWSPKSGAEFVPPPLGLGRHPSCPDDEDWRCFLSSQSLKKYISYIISYIDWILWIRYHFKLITFYFCESHISILCESKKCITIINVQQWMMEVFWILEIRQDFVRNSHINQYYNHVFVFFSEENHPAKCVFFSPSTPTQKKTLFHLAKIFKSTELQR